MTLLPDVAAIALALGGATMLLAGSVRWRQAARLGARTGSTPTPMPTPVTVTGDADISRTRPDTPATPVQPNRPCLEPCRHISLHKAVAEFLAETRALGRVRVIESNDLADMFDCWCAKRRYHDLPLNLVLGEIRRTPGVVKWREQVPGTARKRFVYDLGTLEAQSVAPVLMAVAA